NPETGEVWWPEISKEAFADGIKAAVDAYWNWQTSRAGTRAGRRVGFPRFAKKGRDRDRVTFTTGAIRLSPDRRHVTLPTTVANSNGQVIERIENPRPLEAALKELRHLGRERSRRTMG